jgi:hypothetical protein
MTPMDDGLLSSRTTNRRDPSQRILSDIDSAARWKTIRAHPWCVALALIAPCALVAASLFLTPMSPSAGRTIGEDMPAIALPSLAATGITIAPFHASVLTSRVVAAPIRMANTVAIKDVAHAKASPVRKRRTATSTSADVALLSVLVEHIDAQRRNASRRIKVD